MAVATVSVTIGRVSAKIAICRVSRVGLGFEAGSSVKIAIRWASIAESTLNNSHKLSRAVNDFVVELKVTRGPASC